jgi:hypothetical protein
VRIRPGDRRLRSGDITAMLFKKRFLSSPYAFGTTLRNYLDSHRGATSSG